MSIVRFIDSVDEIRAEAVHDATAAPALRKAFHRARVQPLPRRD